MEAARKLRLTAAQTMRLAQRLYEGVEIDGETTGLITYMRTDGTTLSEDAVTECRSVIGKNYGDKYLPDAPRLYKSKAKNAQEAHEAIRPTSIARTPDSLKGRLEDDQWRLYDLIWKRTVASQMENAIMDRMSVDISDGTDDVILRANGSVVAFDGFLTLYHEDRDDEETIDPDEDDGNDRRLPPMNEGGKTKLIDVKPSQHFTQPPPRYTEASLVKRLEELGIGRPSTYASILQVLRDRNYVSMDSRRFVPVDRGRIVTTFLTKFFERYVDYDFTANLEEELDAIAAGHVSWKEALRLFWIDFKAAVDGTKDLTITQVIDHLDEELGPHFFPEYDADGKKQDLRTCKACGTGRLGLKLGKFGAFIGCSNYPECKFTKPLEVPGEGEDSDAAALSNEPKVLGQDPITKRSVSLRRGPYGPYVQIDAPEETADEEAKRMAAYDAEIEEWKEAKKVAKKVAKKAGEKAPKKPPKPKPPAPKRQGLPQGLTVGEVTLEKALDLLKLPREIGPHPETGKMIKAGIGRFGPFVVHDGKYASLQKDDDVMHIGMNRAVELIANKMARDAEKAANGGKAPARKKAPVKKKSATKKNKTTKK